jgi:protein involved in polysaccharide export with SLBB domain
MRLFSLFKHSSIGLLIVFLASTALHGQNPAVPSPVTPSVGAAPTTLSAGVSQTPAVSKPPAEVTPPVALENGIYAVAPEDVVDVKVFEEPDLETTARVGKDGMINFPLIGAVSIAGKTPDEAARAIGGELAKNYLVNPQVTITVIEYAKRTFTVLGEVQKPGSYDMPDRRTLTLLEAIGAAGGYTRLANPAKIRLKRLGGDKETIFKLDAKSMANERQTASFEIKAGDIITVGETFF